MNSSDTSENSQESFLPVNCEPPNILSFSIGLHGPFLDYGSYADCYCDECNGCRISLYTCKNESCMIKCPPHTRKCPGCAGPNYLTRHRTNRRYRRKKLLINKSNKSDSIIDISMFSTTSSVNNASIVTTEWVAQNYDSIIPVDGSWHMPNTNRNAYEEYFKTRLKNARFFGIDEVKDKTTDLPHMLPTPKDFSEAVGNLGISEKDHVVVYDSIGNPRKTVFGHERVSLLEGGLPKWLEEGRPVESGPIDIIVSLVRNYNDIRNNIDRGKDSPDFEQVLDARPEARPGLPSGHMPYSISVPFNSIIDPNIKTTFLNDDELKKLFQSKNIDLEKPIVLSCGSGVTATMLYTALEKIGAKKLAVYDGSWTEYAGKEGSPIVGRK
ncbi:4508_t:CDS:2 [Dentiscutata heterogama]|uniref:4508_t:CDS:1 n=1 Tax=Dentiscutata heterogama TaxID=1316150 RepID=A0ACA9KSP8_9GLOM|nr:4508_t:CDS:2 [Dentiscutata heterogama]